MKRDAQGPVHHIVTGPGSVNMIQGEGTINVMIRNPTSEMINDQKPTAMRLKVGVSLNV